MKPDSAIDTVARHLHENHLYTHGDRRLQNGICAICREYAEVIVEMVDADRARKVRAQIAAWLESVSERDACEQMRRSWR